MGYFLERTSYIFLSEAEWSAIYNYATSKGSTVNDVGAGEIKIHGGSHRGKISFWFFLCLQIINGRPPIIYLVKLVSGCIHVCIFNLTVFKSSIQNFTRFVWWWICCVSMFCTHRIPPQFLETLSTQCKVMHVIPRSYVIARVPVIVSRVRCMFSIGENPLFTARLAPWVGRKLSVEFVVNLLLIQFAVTLYNPPPLSIFRSPQYLQYFDFKGNLRKNGKKAWHGCQKINIQEPFFYTCYQLKTNICHFFWDCPLTIPDLSNKERSDSNCNCCCHGLTWAIT